jgi:fibronectin-binding autotransporter adhesin
MVGGIFTPAGYTGPITFAAPSTLAVNAGGGAIGGTWFGSADVTIRGVAEGSLWSGLLLYGDTSRYTGNILLESGNTLARGRGRLGSGLVRVDDGAKLVLSAWPGDAATVVANTIELRGGSLVNNGGGFGSPELASVVSGQVIVHERSFVGAFGETYGPGLTLAGRTTLRDGASVFGASSDNVRFAGTVAVAGDLEVGAGTSWTPLVTTLSVTGRIVAGSPDASIDFRGSSERLKLSTARLHADAGKRLAVTVNAGDRPMSLAGVGAGLSGDGVLAGSFVIANQAAVRPGSSAGALSIEGDLTLGEGAVYEWEAGGGSADVVNVTGLLDLSPSIPTSWMLRVSGISASTPIGQQWTIASAGRLTGFDARRVVIDASGLPISVRQLSIAQSGQSLILTLVPEPSSVIVASQFVLVAAAHRRRKQCLAAEPRDR